MKKQPDLKKRLDELRHEPEPPVEVALRLEADIYQKLQSLALQENLSVAAYIAERLHEFIEQADNESEA